MKNVTIQQNTSYTETVSSVLIDKLFNLARNNEITMELSGRLSTNAAYEDSVEYLTNKFKNLYIDVKDSNYYIRFADSVFEQICVSNFSTDKIGVTKQDLSSVQRIDNEFATLDIKTLTDPQYFTNTRITINRLYYITPPSNAGEIINPSGIDIKMPKAELNFTGAAIGSNEFGKNLKINNFDWNGAVVSSNNYIFWVCRFDWNDSFIPDMTDLSNVLLFRACVTDKVIYREGIKKTNDDFNGCDIPYIVFPSTIQHIGRFFDDFRRDGSWGGAVVFKSVNPPEFNDSTTQWPRLPNNIYVPDNSYEKYKNLDHPLWIRLGIGDLITKMSEAPQTIKEICGITQEDIDRV